MVGRSGTPSTKVVEELKVYKGTDVCVRALACDVGSRTDVMHTVESLRDLPEVSGIIHGALYLRASQPKFDFHSVLTIHKRALFIHATFEDWQQVMEAKVTEASNLYELFSDLNSFVALSSMTGVVGRTRASLYAGTSMSACGPLLGSSWLTLIEDIPRRVLWMSVQAGIACCCRRSAYRRRHRPGS